MKFASSHKAKDQNPEAEERAHLADVQRCLQRTVQKIDARLSRYQQEIQEQKGYLWENRSEMDHVEKIAMREAIGQTVMTGDSILAQRTRLLKLARSPYFGRFDFAQGTGTASKAYYIGVHHFYDEHEKEHLVFDWRAPIATLFYDFETGPAAYLSPAGEIPGKVTLKRQFRIRDGVMEFMLESGLNIVDDVLQKELAQASDDGMKNIVATIQRDQNAIIRDEDAQTLIIQGVAGSGKTSIALHRIAFLLYRFKETLSSRDILILSPNRVFADYISNVLPELGEESVAEIGMEQLADELLERKVPFQTFFEQIALLLETNDAAMRQRIAVKSSADFLKKLGAYAEHVEATIFTAADLSLGRRCVPARFIADTFARHRGVAVPERLTRVVGAIETKLGIDYNYDISSEERRTLRAALKKMHRTATLRTTYKGFYDWLGEPELFKPAKGSKLEYADLFPLIYLKLRLEGVDNPHKAVKHLLIDEMQDYTPVQYAVLARLFACRKTILGDVTQAVNPYSASRAEDIQKAFAGANFMTLTKSYRSTLPIMQFAQHICFNPDLVPMERPGRPALVLACRSKGEEMTAIRQQAEEFRASDHNTLGIICKTQKQAEKIAAGLNKEGFSVRLLDARSAVFSGGIIVCTAHLAKGLEFDRVVVPDVSAATYHTPMDRNMLYVACTRAMHVLVLTHTEAPSDFLPR
ncbi:MAG: AAA family ATPase [Desulfuromonadales bacterium]|nr:AAA family ATPase [Desulfuromonadales bacterium]